MKNKSGMELVLQVTKQVQKNSFIGDVLPDQIPKITFANLRKPFHNIICFSFICPFKSGKSRKGKIQKNEYLKNQKSFLDDIETSFKLKKTGQKLSTRPE